MLLEACWKPNEPLAKTFWEHELCAGASSHGIGSNRMIGPAQDHARGSTCIAARWPGVWRHGRLGKWRNPCNESCDGLGRRSLVHLGRRDPNARSYTIYHWAGG